MRFLKMPLRVILVILLVFFISPDVAKAQQQLTGRQFQLRQKAMEYVLAKRTHNAAVNNQIKWYDYCNSIYPTRCKHGEYANANAYAVRCGQNYDLVAQTFRELSATVIAQIESDRRFWESQKNNVCNDASPPYGSSSCTDAKEKIWTLSQEIQGCHKIITWAYETR